MVIASASDFSATMRSRLASSHARRSLAGLVRATSTMAMAVTATAAAHKSTTVQNQDKRGSRRRGGRAVPACRVFDIDRGGAVRMGTAAGAGGGDATF